MKASPYYLLSAAIGAFVALVPYIASAAPITEILTVNVYDVCDDFGANCASTGLAGDAYYAAEVNDIWAQAGIEVVFNSAGQIDSTQYSNLNESVPGDGLANLGEQVWGPAGPNDITEDMFLVHTIAGAYGEAYLGEGGLAIAMDTVDSYNNGFGR